MGTYLALAVALLAGCAHPIGPAQPASCAPVVLPMLAPMQAPYALADIDVIGWRASVVCRY